MNNKVSKKNFYWKKDIAGESIKAKAYKKNYSL